MRKLLLRPDSAGYTAQDGASVIATELDGGLSRSRVDKVGMAKRVNASWTLNPVQHQYWRAFYITASKEGALPFLCDLVSDDACGPVEHKCKFVPGTVSISEQIGLKYVHQAQLEVEPVRHDETLDEFLFELWETFGGEPTEHLNYLERIVNITLPDYWWYPPVYPPPPMPDVFLQELGLAKR